MHLWQRVYESHNTFILEPQSPREAERGSVSWVHTPLHTAEAEARRGRTRRLQAVAQEERCCISRDVHTLECRKNDDPCDLHAEVRPRRVRERHNACQRVTLRAVEDGERAPLGLAADVLKACEK